MRFRAKVELGGKTATGISVPDDVVAAIGSGRRPKVQVTVGGHSYRTTVASRGGRYFVPLSKENREAAGLAAGDATARGFFDRLSYTHQTEWVRWVEEAKKAETRATRIAKTVESLHAGRTVG